MAYTDWYAGVKGPHGALRSETCARHSCADTVPCMGSNETSVSMVTMVGSAMVAGVWGLEQAGIQLPGPVQQAIATMILGLLTWLLPKHITKRE